MIKIFIVIFSVLTMSCPLKQENSRKWKIREEHSKKLFQKILAKTHETIAITVDYAIRRQMQKRRLNQVLRFLIVGTTCFVIRPNRLF